MIVSEKSLLRFSEPEDAIFYKTLYVEGGPKAALLDARREFAQPSLAEIQEILRKSEAARALLFTVEDREGRLRGWCGLRALSMEARYCELFLVFASEEDYAGRVAQEALAALLDRAFSQLNLDKVIATCLDVEEALHACLLQAGFLSCGVQREVLFSGGVWRGLDTLVLDRQTYTARAEKCAPGMTVS